MAVLANMKHATESMIRGFNTNDAHALISCRAPDCLQHLLPKSLDRPPQTNTEYEQFMLNAWQTFTDWKVRDKIRLRRFPNMYLPVCSGSDCI
jgi:hypothetical protein